MPPSPHDPSTGRQPLATTGPQPGVWASCLFVPLCRGSPRPPLHPGQPRIPCAVLGSVAHSCLTPRPHGLEGSARRSVPGDSPGKMTGVGSLSLLRRVFSPQDQTQVSHTAGGFFTCWATREPSACLTHGQFCHLDLSSLRHPQTSSSPLHRPPIGQLFPAQDWCLFSRLCISWWQEASLFPINTSMYLSYRCLWLWFLVCLYQHWQTLSIKGRIVNISGFEVQTVSITLPS